MPYITGRISRSCCPKVFYEEGIFKNFLKRNARPVPFYFVHAKVVHVYVCTQSVYFTVVFINVHYLHFRFYLPIFGKCSIILFAIV